MRQIISNIHNLPTRIFKGAIKFRLVGVAETNNLV